MNRFGLVLCVFVSLIAVCAGQTALAVQCGVNSGLLPATCSSNRFVASYGSLYQSNSVTTSIAQGTLVGTVSNNVASFLGIPYAAPPLGSLRFMPPKDPSSWFPRTRRAIAQPPSCMQGIGLDGDMYEPMSEDCLYLNVFTPYNYGLPRSPLPVIIFLYGGDFMTGGINTPLYQAQQMASTGQVVVVTINFRSSIFGYAAFPNMTTNIGILDQQKAFAWVQNNIYAFGGNKYSVTLMGQSSGAILACMHMVIPSSWPYFSKVISDSGSCTQGVLGPSQAGWLQAVDAGYTQAAMEMASCSLNTVCDLNCMQQMSACDLNSYATSVVGTSIVAFLPAVDGVLIPADPLYLFNHSKIAKVPLLAGTNQDEGTYFMSQTFTSPWSWTDFDQAVQSLWLPQYVAQVEAMYNTSYYDTYSTQFMGTPAFRYNYMFGDAFADLIFQCSTRRMLRLHAKTGQKSYQYYYTHISDELAVCATDPSNAVCQLAPLGAFHGSELYELFNVPEAGVFSAAEKKLSTQMIKLWTSFAATGVPSASGVPTWPTFANNNEAYLVIDETYSVGHHLRASVCDFWDSITVAGGTYGAPYYAPDTTGDSGSDSSSPSTGVIAVVAVAAACAVAALGFVAVRVIRRRKDSAQAAENMQRAAQDQSPRSGEAIEINPIATMYDQIQAGTHPLAQGLVMPSPLQFDKMAVMYDQVRSSTPV